MMRLSPPGYAKFSQSTMLEMAFGGGEANVAISLAYMGLDAAHVTRFPDNLVGRSATQFLRHHWLDTSWIGYGDGVMGKYFLEKGAVHRPSEVVYERDHSAFALIEEDTFDWGKILKDADWLHWTGITPALSEGAAKSCLIAIETANRMGVKVSADIHSRKSLWCYGKSKKEIMPALIAGCDYVIAGAYDIAEIFDIDLPEKDGKFRAAAQQLRRLYPSIKTVFDKNRVAVSASHNRIQGVMWNGENVIRTPELDVTHIVDRVGTGDAYAAGIVYGLLHYKDQMQALKFATAACALKHTVEGDANMVSVENIVALMEGNTSGNIIR